MSKRARIQHLLLRSLVKAPPLVRRLAGPPPVIRGQQVDADSWWIASLATLTEAADPDPKRLRQQYAQASVVLDAPVPESVTWEDRPLTMRDGHDITVRVYTPEEPSGSGIVYLHGGGFVIGDLQSHHSLCARLARDTRAIVVAVDYRRAPEHPFPTPWNDAVDAWQGIAADPDAYGIEGPLAVAGDSAGGNLAVWVAWAAETAPALIWALYPTVDAMGTYPSTDDFGERLFLTKKRKHWFSKHTFERGDRATRQAAPLRFDPTREDGTTVPTIVTVAGMDILRDEGEAYIDHLSDAGTLVSSFTAEGQLHGFAALCRFPGPQAAWERCMSALRPHLESAS